MVPLRRNRIDGWWNRSVSSNDYLQCESLVGMSKSNTKSKTAYEEKTGLFVCAYRVSKISLTPPTSS